MNDARIPVGVTGVFANPLDVVFTKPLDYIDISTTVGSSIDSKYIEVEHCLRKTEQRVEQIEKLLKIIDRDIDMEKKYPELARIADEYNATLEKYKTWDNLNDDYNQRTRQR